MAPSVLFIMFAIVVAAVSAVVLFYAFRPVMDHPVDSPQVFASHIREEMTEANLAAIASKDVAAVRFPLAVRGYDPHTVDEFLAAIAAGEVPAVPEFPVTRGGYRMDSVDAVVAAVLPPVLKQ